MYALPCCVEAPSSFVNKARYSLEMLLFPLGIRPLWVNREELGQQGLYYGTEVKQAPAESVCYALDENDNSIF